MCQWDGERAGSRPEIEHQLASCDGRGHTCGHGAIDKEVLTEMTAPSVPLAGAPCHGDAPRRYPWVKE